MNHIGQVINTMIAYYTGDVRRINHFLKVYGFAKAIGEMEGLDESTQEILEIAALIHGMTAATARTAMRPRPSARPQSSLSTSPSSRTFSVATRISTTSTST